MTGGADCRGGLMRSLTTRLALQGDRDATDVVFAPLVENSAGRQPAAEAQAFVLDGGSLLAVFRISCCGWPGIRLSFGHGRLGFQEDCIAVKYTYCGAYADFSPQGLGYPEGWRVSCFSAF